MHIIVLDNSTTVQSKIEELLLKMDIDNLDINLFENAEEALDYSRSNDVKLIFSSIETDGMDGVSFIDNLLRVNPKYISSLFIVTSQKHTESMEDIKELGVKRFIPKPINENYFNHFVKAEIDKILKNI